MRIFILSIICLSLFSSEIPQPPTASAGETQVDRILAIADDTGKINAIKIYDINLITDHIGLVNRSSPRIATVEREDNPTFFAALDALLARTSERDTRAREFVAEQKAKEEEKRIKRMEDKADKADKADKSIEKGKEK